MWLWEVQYKTKLYFVYVHNSQCIWTGMCPAVYMRLHLIFIWCLQFLPERKLLMLFSWSGKGIAVWAVYFIRLRCFDNGLITLLFDSNGLCYLKRFILRTAVYEPDPIEGRASVNTVRLIRIPPSMFFDSGWIWALFAVTGNFMQKKKNSRKAKPAFDLRLNLSQGKLVQSLPFHWSCSKLH